MIDANEAIDLFNNKNDFINEKAFQKFIENNIDVMTKDLFNDVVISYARESYIFPMNKPIFGKGNRSRVDFFIEGRKAVYIIECKCPTSTGRELNRGIAQILDYHLAAEEHFSRKHVESWIITTKYHKSLVPIILRYKLPINICLLNKNKQAIFKYDI